MAIFNSYVKLPEVDLLDPFGSFKRPPHPIKKKWLHQICTKSKNRNYVDDKQMNSSFNGMYIYIDTICIYIYMYM